MIAPLPPTNIEIRGKNIVVGLVFDTWTISPAIVVVCNVVELGVGVDALGVTERLTSEFNVARALGPITVVRSVTGTAEKFVPSKLKPTTPTGMVATNVSTAGAPWDIAWSPNTSVTNFEVCCPAPKAKL